MHRCRHLSASLERLPGACEGGGWWQVLGVQEVHLGDCRGGGREEDGRRAVPLLHRLVAADARGAAGTLYEIF